MATGMKAGVSIWPWAVFSTPALAGPSVACTWNRLVIGRVRLSLAMEAAPPTNLSEYTAGAAMLEEWISRGDKLAQECSR